VNVALVQVTGLGDLAVGQSTAFVDVGQLVEIFIGSREHGVPSRESKTLATGKARLLSLLTKKASQ